MTSTLSQRASDEQTSKIRESYELILEKHLGYCRKNDWGGEDPYDALHSKVFKALPFLNYRLPRIALTQALKRSPINLRSLLLIPKTRNSKALALFLSAFLKLSTRELPDRDELVQEMVNSLISLRSPDVPYWCWGYSFHWQGRFILVPAGTPNLVCTYFVATALLDVYESTGNSQCLEMAVSAAEYMLNVLYWTEGDSIASFSYPLPALRTQVYNANFLASALFCRVSKHTGEKKFLAPALEATRYSAGKQREDGSWYYGAEPSQNWIDNFHTGYNLCALQSISRDTGTTEFDAHIRRGFAFFRDHFFCRDGSVKYFHDRIYPIDTHCIAQSIITLSEFKHLDPGNVELARSVFQWTVKNMWDDRGYFYYRRYRIGTNRISYMRWTQVWMFLALATMLKDCDEELEKLSRLESGLIVA